LRAAFIYTALHEVNMAAAATAHSPISTSSQIIAECFSSDIVSRTLETFGLGFGLAPIDSTVFNEAEDRHAGEYEDQQLSGDQVAERLCASEKTRKIDEHARRARDVRQRSKPG
jgi:hypothetical protein